MNLENQIRPYYVCGGFPTDNSWTFFTPSGEIEVKGCNLALEILLPMCNGNNRLDFIVAELKKTFKKGEIEELLSALFQYLILVDSGRIFQAFYAYSKNPMPFFESLSQDETFNFVSDQSHLPSINGSCIEVRFEKTNLQKTMDLRCSTRNFSEESMGEESIFSLLWCAYGAQEKREAEESNFLEKTYTVPSGGALYPLFIYLILFKQSDSLGKGVYLWHKEKNILELVNGGDFLARAGEIITGIPSLEKATGVLCVVADFERSAKKYGNKAYNLIQQEVGHVMQNTALFCAENNFGIVEIGGYNDEELAYLLSLPFPNQSPLIVAAFGRKKE